MTPEAQRIAIAETMGWRECVTESLGCHGKFPKEYRGDVMNPFTGEDRAWIPDYLNDLNAMHDAEKVLSIKLPSEPFTESEKTRYVISLRQMCGGKGCVVATASERAEAFLRTIGKWDDVR